MNDEPLALKHSIQLEKLEKRLKRLESIIDTLVGNMTA